MSADTGPLRSSDSFIDVLGKQKRGRLKLYLGAAAGVGKTYRMLVEGKSLRESGVDVAIGYLEPHERVETIAQAEGLEQIPVRVVQHGTLQVREMDVDAVLQRHPKVALVDELAHTNAPGSRNAKRYEDVEELLAAGISVITTLNVQHLESLYNIVEDATGIRVTERIPDAIVGKADFIIDVDLEADDLIERLKAGKIYKLDRIDTALNNFFSVKNLTRLREIALSETANLLDQRQRGTLQVETKKSALAKVMLALSSDEENPGTILRKTSRLATQLNAEWYVVTVTTLEEEARLLSPNHEHMERASELAQSMGAEVVHIKDENVAQSLAQFAKANGITHLVIRRPKTRTWRRPFHKNYFDILAKDLPEVDIVVG